MLSLTTAALALNAPLASRDAASSAAAASMLDRRAVLAGGLLGAVSSIVAPMSASAEVEAVNPANNYYFPMAKYRYLPRIFRAWITVDQLAPAALEVGDWEGMQVAWERIDDAVTAMPLYTSAVEGSRSTKRKKKSDTQKTMMKKQVEYKAAVKDLGTAVTAKNREKAVDAVRRAKESLLVYRQLAQIDGPDGGVISLPLGNAQEAGHAGAPLGYVVPAFRGGGVSMDYALRDGEPMMKGGQITQEYRDRYQTEDVETKKGKK